MESGSDDEYESDEAGRPVGEVLKTGKIQSKAIIKKGKDKDTDIVPKTVAVLSNFYQENDSVTLEMPKLPRITPSIICGQPDDYKDYEDKVSSWYLPCEKKQKFSAAGAPSTKLSFTCACCDWSFATSIKCTRHRSVHFNTGVFICQACHSLFSYEDNMQNHWKSYCTPLSTSGNDAEKKGVDPKNFRSCLMAEMLKEKRIGQYHVFGGTLFQPSDWTLAQTDCIIVTAYHSLCYLCNLAIPNKYIECHGDVHRGRYRIDMPIYDEYFCHICGKCFKQKENLINHWRTACQEVIAYTPDDVFLDDEELAALVWLILQQTISHEKMREMAKATTMALEMYATEHAKSNGVQKCIDNYYHFPQEIWPLQTYTALDIVKDAIPIQEKDTFKIEDKTTPVHTTNLFATLCPIFYATGLMFTEICSTPVNMKDAKTVYKVILRYTTEGSIIKTYKFNPRVCPRMSHLKTKLSSQNSSAVVEMFDVESKNKEKCEKCEKNSIFLSFSCKYRFTRHSDRHSSTYKGSDWCDFCQKIVGIRSMVEHLQSDCEVIKAIFTNFEDRSVIDLPFKTAFLQNFISVKPTIRLEYPYRKGSDAIQKKQTADRIGEDVRVAFELDSVLKKKLLAACSKLLDTARHRKMHPEDERRFVKPDAVVIICPHCGGRFGVNFLILHLENRHFYPKRNNSLKEKLSEWLKGDRKETMYRPIRNLSEELRVTMKFMPEDVYNKCCEYNFGESPGVYLDEWSEIATVREIESDAQLTVVASSEYSNPVHALDVSPGKTIYAPQTGAVTDMTNMITTKGDVWLPADPRMEIPTVPQIDPSTGEPLEEAFARIQKACDDVFFGTFQLEALTNGVNILSLTDLFNPSTTSKNADPDDNCNDDQEDENMRIDDIDLDNNEDDNELVGEELVKKLGDAGAKRLEDPEFPRHDEIYSDEAEGCALRTRAVQVARNKQKLESNAHKDLAPAPYDEAHFAPRKIMLDPAKAKQLQYLSDAVDEDEDNEDDDMEELEMDVLALNLPLENATSEFRAGARNFRLHYLEGREPERVTREVVAQAGTTIMYSELSKGHKMEGVVDEHGTVFIGGFLKPLSTKYGEKKWKQYEKIHVNRNGRTTKFVVYPVINIGKNPTEWYLWPDEQRTGINQSKHLRRVKFVPWNPPRLSLGGVQHAGSDGDEDGAPGPSEPMPMPMPMPNPNPKPAKRRKK